MGIVIKDLNPVSIGGVRFATGQLDFDSSYPTGGEPILTSLFGVTTVKYFKADNKSGYVFEYDYDNNKLKVYMSAGVAIAGSISSDTAGTPAGTNTAPAFTGTGLGTHTHDMKYIGGLAATEPVVIAGGDTLGKNAATDRTIAGADSATKGGVVAITAGTPAGSVAAPAFTGTAMATHTHTLTGTAVAATAMAEVANATDLSALTGVRFLMIGN